MNKIINGKEIAAKLNEELKKEISNLPSSPKLVVIQVGDLPASNVYIKNKEKACLDLGIDFELVKFDENIITKKIEDKIIELNNNFEVDGILIQLPLSNHLDINKLINTINPAKDVDGLTSTNIGNVINNITSHISCTAGGIIKLLDEYEIDIKGKHVVIIGRSSLVGKPLIHLLLNKDATVSICHSKTNNLQHYTKQADILIVAVGIPKFINKQMIKKDAIIIDVGINRVDNNILGDIDFEDVYDKCSLITPVPGGIGPMTIHSLINNIINSYKETKRTDN